MSVYARDLHWAAGFLEGEGSFTFSKAGHLQVRAPQVNREPLDKLRGILRGGSFYLYEDKAHPNHKPVHCLQFVGNRAAGICMTLFPLMSTKRQWQIKIALSGWKAKRVKGIYAHKCIHGHPFTKENIYWWHGKRHCRACRSYNDQVRRGWRKAPKWENCNPGERLNFQCKRGHDLMNESNIYSWKGKRYCVPCRDGYMKQYRASRKEV